jgi:RNA polymerase sigma factor (sigma-70 family)
MGVRLRERPGSHGVLDGNKVSGTPCRACPPAKLDRDLESKDLRKAIEECMERLPELQRRVFVLRDMEEVATEEVCKILDISSTNMFVLTFRARNRLRECLERKMAGKQE